jgi:hypothetical protein
MNSFFRLAAWGFPALVIWLIFYCDIALPDIVETSDYLTCMYTAAKLYVTHRWDEIYTPYGASTFINQPCDIAAHQFLPHFSKSLIAEFNYCPLLAALLVPLSYLPPNYSLLVFQLISILALIVSICLLVKTPSDRVKASLLATLFFPIPVSIWIGQVDLLVGMLPFSIGYLLLYQKKLFLAGLVFAVSALKPQFLIVPIIMGTILLCLKKWQFIAGLIIGGIAFILLNVAFSSFDLFVHWLWSISLCERIFTNPSGGFAQRLMVSLPGTLVRWFPASQFSAIKLVSYGIALLVSLAVIWRGISQYKANVDWHSWLPDTLVLILLVMPLVLPNFLYYDLSLYFLAYLFFKECPANKRGSLFLARMYAFGLLLTNAFLLSLFIWRENVKPQFLLAAFAIMFTIWLTKNKNVLLQEEKL